MSVCVSRVAAAYVKCEVCKEAFPEGNEIFAHTQSCQGMRDIENNIMSPASSRSQGTVMMYQYLIVLYLLLILTLYLASPP